MTKLVFNLFSEIDELESDWNNLGLRVKDYSFYKKPAWFKAFKDALADPDNKYYFIAIYQQNRLFGIIPVEYVIHKLFFISARVITLLSVISSTLIFRLVRSFSFIGSNLGSLLIALIVFLINSRAILFSISFMFQELHAISHFKYTVTKTFHCLDIRLSS